MAVYKTILIMKTQNSNYLSLIIYIIIIFLFFGCGPKPKQSVQDHDEIRKKAQEKFNQVDKNKSNLAIDYQIGGIETSKAGDLNTPLAELDRDQLEIYKTDEPGWVSISLTKRFSDNINRVDAKNKMLSEMRNDAINRKVSKNLKITQLITDRTASFGNESIDQSTWSGFFISTVSAIITEEIQQKNNIIPFDEGQGFDLDLEYDFFVTPVKGEPDPSYFIDAYLEKDMLNNGDELSINIKPSQDSYVYVFNMMADNNAVLMFPNEFMNDNLIRSNKNVVIPNEEIKDYISFIVGTMPGETLTSEYIYIVCTKKNIPVPKSIPTIGTILKPFASDSRSFFELQKWLSNIPLHQRVDNVLIYHVSKK